MQGYKLPSYERMRNKLIPDVNQQTKEEVDKTVILDIWSTKSMQDRFHHRLCDQGLQEIHYLLVRKANTGPPYR